MEKKKKVFLRKLNLLSERCCCLILVVLDWLRKGPVAAQGCWVESSIDNLFPYWQVLPKSYHRVGNDKSLSSWVSQKSPGSCTLTDCASDHRVNFMHLSHACWSRGGSLRVPIPIALPAKQCPPTPPAGLLEAVSPLQCSEISMTISDL